MSLATIKSGQLIESSLISERNPVSCHIQYIASDVAPHATTDRETYTVPAGKIAILKTALAHNQVKTAATTSGTKETYITLRVSAVEYHFCFQKQGADKNTVGQNETRTVTVDVLLNAGDRVRISTRDLSTGGTVDYIATVLITQYDL